jgi:uncharacterized protein YciI
MAAMKYLMSYRAVEDFGPLAQANLAGHRARLQEFHERGVLLLAGPLAEPGNGDAIGVFTSREAAEEFVAGDPFVVNGVVAEWSIRSWNEVLQPER